MNSIADIDVHELVCRLWNRKKFIAKFLLVFVVIGAVVAFSIPKSYRVDVMLSPESGQSGSGNLSGMASMLGITNIGGNTKDALNSSMFPDLIKSTPFILEVYNINVTSEDGKEMTLSEYIKTQKKPWWGYVFGLPGRAFRGVMSLFHSEDSSRNEKRAEIDPFKLTPEQSRNITAIKNALSVTVDKKSAMTVVSVTFQDPVVAAITADSAVMKLQKYIIDYRTKKAQADCDYLEKVCMQRKDEYLKTQRAYADFMDMNRNVVLQRTQAEGTRLQNDMSIAFQVYSQVETQLQVARAKVQEAKPVFAIIEPATVPLHSTSPNKKIILAGFIFLGVVCSIAWVLFGDKLWNSFKLEISKKKENLD